MAFVEETSVNRAAYVKRSRKHRYIKPFALLLAAVLLCGLTGCSKNGTSSPGSSLGDSQNISSDSSIENFEPVPVPDGGWTAESLAKTIRINGMVLPNPVTVENLGKGYDVDETHTLIYNRLQIAVIVFDNESANLDNCKKNIRAFALNTNAKMDVKAFYVNGITLGSSAVEAIKAFGEPLEKTSQNVWVYYENGKGVDDNIMVLWFDDEDNISWISIRL